MSWTNVTKHTTSFTNATKNATTYTTQSKTTVRFTAGVYRGFGGLNYSGGESTGQASPTWTAQTKH